MDLSKTKLWELGVLKQFDTNNCGYTHARIKLLNIAKLNLLIGCARSAEGTFMIARDTCNSTIPDIITHKQIFLQFFACELG